MEYTVEDISPVKKKVVVEVPPEEANAALGTTIAMYRKDAALDGFRKGKVPSSIIEKRFRKQIYNEATTELVNVHVNQIMNELKAMPVSGIDFDGGELERDKTFTYSISFEVMPEFDVPEYEGLSVEEEEPEVNEDEVQEVFDRIRANMAELVPVVEDREPRDGEVATISFKAFDDEGAPMPGIKAESFDLTLGEGQALAEFEEAVKKLRTSDTSDTPITFPEDFLNPDLAGKTVEMRIKLHAIKEKKLPPMTDDLAQKAGGFESVEKMSEAIRNSYMESRRQVAQSVAQKKLLDTLVAKTEYPLPETMVEQHVQRMISERRGKLEQQGKSLESTGVTEEQLREEFREPAEDLVRSEIFLLAVAKRENLEVSDQELDFFFKQQAARSGEDAEQLKQFHIQNNLIFAVRDRLLSDKAMELIYDKAEIKKVPAGQKESDEPAAPEAEGDAE